MAGTGARFHYPLQALLRKCEWDVAAIAAELATARRALLEHEDRARRLQQSLDQLDASVAGLRAPGAQFDLAHERRLLDYRAAQDECLAAEALQLASARQHCEQIAEQLTRARRAVQGYEHHREDLQRTHVRAVATAAAKESDDAWLAGQHWREGNR